MSIYSLSSLLSFSIFIFLSAIVICLNFKNKINKIFFALCLSLAFWAISDFGFKNANSYNGAILWMKIYSVWHLCLAISVHFTLEFTKKKNILKNPITLFGLYGISLLLIYVDFLPVNLHNQIQQTQYGWTYNLSININDIHFWADLLWLIITCGISCGLNIHYYFTVKNKIIKKQAKYISLGFLVPVLSGMTSCFLNIFSESEVFDITTSLFTVTSILIAYGICKHKLFLLTPANAAENIITTMSDALIIIDNEDKIQMVNNAACRMLDSAKSELIGKKLNNFLVQEGEVSSLLEKTWFNSILSYGSIKDINMHIVSATARAIPVSLSASVLKDATGEIAGMIFICRDVTERRRNEEALKKAQEELEFRVAQRTEELKKRSEELKLELANRIAAEEELRNSEKRYRAIVEDHSEIICRFIKDTTVTFVNSAFCRYFGISLEAIMGKPLLMFIAKEDKEFFEKNILDTMSGNFVKTFECRVIDVNYNKRWVQFIIRPLFDEEIGFLEFQAIGIDITDRKKAENELAAEKERLSVTLSSIAEGVIATNSDGKIIFINHAAENLMGFKEEEALGRHVDDCLYIVNEKTLRKCLEPFNVIIKKESVVSIEENAVLISKNGTRYNVSFIGAPIRDNNKNIIGTVYVFRDITERILLESELFKSKKLESMGALATGIANDFSNLLSELVIHLFCAKVHTKAGDDSYKFITQAEAVVNKASRLVKQLLTFSKSGPLIKERISIKTVIEDSVGFALSSSKCNRILDIAKDLLPVEIDKGQIDQAISNIVVNADQAMPNGGTITISAKNVFIGENSQSDSLFFVHAQNLKPGNYICISIKDEGEGISKENLEKIFDPYFTTKPNSNGLGLTTAYSIIKKHDGYISVSSEQNKGSVFNIYLPAITGEKEEQKKEAFKALKIIVLDSDGSIQKYSKDIIPRFGFEAQYTSNWEELFSVYKNEIGSKIKSFIIFAEMDEKNKEYFNMLYELDENVSIIAYTSNPQKLIISDNIHPCVVDCILKPFSLEDVSIALQKAIEKAKINVT
jgi:PAS domain S-box-containing protein